ncbi:MAG TPA: ANTAR domain-containing protein [Gammaproteobacteria bacterium]|nr:ANTAR domain-containing protein [Gammaproteobacteria bacterium]
MTSKRLRILIAGGDVRRAAILAEGLQDAAVVARFDGGAHLGARVAALDPDVILVDLGKPSEAALAQTLDLARSARRPIAVFVDESDAAAMEAAVEAGVSAYVVDGLKKERIKAIVDLAVARFRALERVQDELRRAREALEERKLVERAKSILMQQRNLSEQDAYTLLRRTAMSRNRKLVDLARAVIDAAGLLRESDVNAGDE